jgi:hypothetical protein
MPPQLNFSGQNTLRATHGLHAYAAKCPPQLVKYAVRHFSKRGEIVLDPMMGSGTTLVESTLMGRSAVGYDIDPLARLIAEVKCSQLEDDDIVRYQQKLAVHLANVGDLNGSTGDGANSSAGSRQFGRWFSPNVASDLAKLASAIAELAAPLPIRKFFWVAFSSLILARTSVANARDIIHSRHHRFEHTEEPNN